MMPIPLVEYLLHANSEDKPVLKSQWADVVASDCVTCTCGHNQAVIMTYRCLYCGIWFCSECAGKHFGAEYQAYVERSRSELFDKLMKEKGLR